MLAWPSSGPRPGSSSLCPQGSHFTSAWPSRSQPASVLPSALPPAWGPSRALFPTPHRDGAVTAAAALLPGPESDPLPAGPTAIAPPPSPPLSRCARPNHHHPPRSALWDTPHALAPSATAVHCGIHPAPAGPSWRGRRTGRDAIRPAAVKTAAGYCVLLPRWAVGAF